MITAAVVDNEQSYLSKLYESVSDMEACNPRLPDAVSGEDGFVCLREIQQKMINSMDYCREQKKEIVIDDDDIGCNSLRCEANTIYAELKRLPPPRDLTDSCCVEVIEARKFKEVMFTNTRFKNNAFKPPKFKMVVPPCAEPNTVQNLNTGYIIDVPAKFKEHRLVEGRIVVDGRDALQHMFVIIPKIKSNDQNIVPAIHARDADDTGPFTVSVYNRLGVGGGKLSVYLYAYRVPLDLLTSVRIENSEECMHLPPLNPKDSVHPKRHVYNFTAKVRFSEAEVAGKSIRLPYADESVPTKIVIDDKFAFFQSRKREWCNPKLFTAPGVFSPDGKSVRSRVAKNSEFCLNTHCCVFLDSRLTLFGVGRNLEPRDLPVNGMMNRGHDPAAKVEYKELKRALSALVRDVYAVRKGVYLSRRFDENKYDWEALMRIYDSNGYLGTTGKKFDRLYANKDHHSRLFEICNGKASKKLCSTTSSRIYKNLKILVSFFYDCDLEPSAARRNLSKRPSTDDQTDGTPKKKIV